MNILKTITASISIVVRTDSSGTTQVFSAALDAISPSGYGITQSGLFPSQDSSFHDQIVSGTNGGSQAPTWCGGVTDELQYITINNCNTTSSQNSSQLNSNLNSKNSSKLLVFKFIDSTFNLQTVEFNCDATATQIREAILLGSNLDVHVTVTPLSSSTSSSTSTSTSTGQGTMGVISNQIEIGYNGTQQQGKNWYNPLLISSPLSVIVSIKPKQEGGFVNTVTSCTGVPNTVQTSSIFLLSGSVVSFSLTWTVGGD